MSGRADTYSSRGEGDSIEELSKRLTADLRRHIRALVRANGVVPTVAFVSHSARFLVALV